MISHTKTTNLIFKDSCIRHIKKGLVVETSLDLLAIYLAILFLHSS